MVGVLSLVADVYERSFTSVSEFCEHIKKQLDYLVTARPTAVNMTDARSRLLQRLNDWTQDTSVTADDVKDRSALCLCERDHSLMYYTTLSSSSLSRN